MQVPAYAKHQGVGSRVNQETRRDPGLSRSAEQMNDQAVLTTGLRPQVAADLEQAAVAQGLWTTGFQAQH